MSAQSQRNRDSALPKCEIIPLFLLFVMCGVAPEQPSLAEEGDFEDKLPLRDYSGAHPDFYFNTSVEEATVAQHNASRFLPTTTTTTTTRLLTQSSGFAFRIPH